MRKETFILACLIKSSILSMQKYVNNQKKFAIKLLKMRAF